MTPEEKARQKIDAQLKQCGWVVQDKDEINLFAARGVAVREVTMKQGHGETDYLLFVDGKAIGTLEAKPAGWTLTGVEEQSAKYGSGVPHGIQVWKSPLPCSYESTGVETRFTNQMEPDPCSREVFAFHRPETLLEWVEDDSTLRHRLKKMPKLITTGLWQAQEIAIQNLERSFADNRPRALIQMATGSGKTFTAINAVYRLVKFAKAQRVLFLVDRGNLGKQAYKEFQQFITPDDGRKFTELYNVQHLQSNKLDKVSRVCITTIQRLYSMLKGEQELAPGLDEESGWTVAQSLFKKPPPVEYNPIIPVEMFDFIIIDECHRSIYDLWRQVLEYFDASLVGLTATPSKQTIGFFNQNLVMEYGHEQAVADGVNVNYDVYRIRTKITEKGSKVEAGLYVDKRDRKTRKKRWEQLDEDLKYDANQLDKDVVAVSQIRTVVRTFKEKLFTEIFPGRKDVPKTLIYAKDDSHADDIVKIVREEFGKGNDFCKKITYKTTGEDIDDLIASFRNSYNPRIAVTVDMIATGTDIKPLEIVLFMRSVKSRTFFEQMKGRGVRIISDTDFQAVTTDAKTKTHFVIVDAVGVCERDKTESRPLERKPSVPFDKLLNAIAMNNREEDVLTSVASRLARLDRRLDEKQHQELNKLSGGQSIRFINEAIIHAVDPDAIEETAKQKFKTDKPTKQQLKEAATILASVAVAPIATKPEFRKRLFEFYQSLDQIIDAVSQDEVTFAGHDAKALKAARSIVQSFEQFIAEHRDEITALQVLYSRPHRNRLTFEQIQELANAIEKPPRRWTTDLLWQAYEKLDKSKVRGTPLNKFADLVSLIRFALHKDQQLAPFAESVNQRFQNWLAQQTALGRNFTAEQRQWLELIRDHIAASLSIEADDLEFAPMKDRGGLARAYQLFGDTLPNVLAELNEVLAA